jgi:hypothetical protein
MLTLLVALAAGIGAGLLVSWVLWPVEYVDVAPHSLMPAHRQEYIVLIGMSYAYDRDLGLAQARLAALGDLAVIGPEVVMLAEKHAVQGVRDEQVRALAMLALALGFRRAALAAYLPEMALAATWTPLPTSTSTPSPTDVPTATPTPTTAPSPTPSSTPTRPGGEQTPTATPARTPTPTPTTNSPPAGPRFQVIERRRTCEPPGGQLMVMVLDEAGQPRPNVELLVRWEDGGGGRGTSGGQEASDRFFTGLKPEIGMGYADFAMEGGQTYELVVVGTESDVAQGLVADACTDGGYLASWYVVFQLSQGELVR